MRQKQFLGIALFAALIACDGGGEPASREQDPSISQAGVEESATEPAEGNSTEVFLPEARSPDRPDHVTTSSRSRCLCFPKGDDCSYPGMTLPPRNPEMACPLDEVCDADFATYIDRSSWQAHGSCLKACYRSDSVLPRFIDWEGQTPDTLFSYDCAPGEDCLPLDVRGSNAFSEVFSIGRVGVCRTTQTTGIRQPDWQ